MVAPEAVAARRLVGGLLAIAVFALIVGVGAVVAMRVGLPGGFLVSLAAAIAATKIGRRFSLVPRELTRETSLSAAASGALTVGTRTLRVGSCRYDPAEELLWIRSRLGVPQTVVRASRDQAWEIVRALQRPELGIRTLRCASGVMALPWLGFPLTLLVVFSASLGLALAYAAPLHIGLPACALTLALAVFSLWPARLHVDEERVEWRWWGWSRRVALAALASVAVTREALVLTDRSGDAHRLRLRHALVRNETLDAQGANAIRAFADYVDSLRRAASAAAITRASSRP